MSLVETYLFDAPKFDLITHPVDKPISSLKFTPRDYQDDCVNAIEQEFGLVETTVPQVQSTLSVLATGLGKTEIFVELMRRHANTFERCMVIAHTKELVAQAAKKIHQRTGIMPDIEQGTQRANETPWGRSPFVVASKASLHENRRARFKGFGLIVVDEAHHFSAANLSYADVWQHFRVDNPQCKLLGVTATPQRTDGLALGQIFDTCAYDLRIAKAVELGWLVDARVNCIEVKSLNLADVPTNSKTGDFNLKQLSKRLEEEKALHEIAAVAVQEGAGKLKTVVFCQSVNQAEAISDILKNDFNVPSDWICGDPKRCTPDRRKASLSAYADGSIRVLCNVAVLTEGWDCPGLVNEENEVLDRGVEHIVMARPTKAIIVYEQMFGRGTRPIPGTVDFEGSTPETRRAAIAASEKPFLRITDLVDNSHKHRLITAVDILGGDRYSPEVVEKAQKNIEKNKKPVDMEKALETAARQIETAKRKHREKEEKRKEKMAMRTVAIYERFEVNPFDLTGQKITDPKQVEPATDKQIKFLKWKRFQGATKLTKREATAVIIRFNGGESMSDIQSSLREAERKRRRRKDRSSTASPASGETQADAVNAMLNGEDVQPSSRPKPANPGVNDINDMLLG